MNAQWRRLPGPLAHEPVFMDAVLTPHRSLSPKGLRLLLLVFALLSAAVGFYVFVQGAWPIIGFLGLDILALWLAFRLNFKAAQLEERVQVSREAVLVQSRSRRGAVHWSVSPLWAQARVGENAVLIASGGAVIGVGAFLSPDERIDFARALSAALTRAKRGS